MANPIQADLAKVWQDISGAEQRLQKYGFAALVDDAAKDLSAAATAIDAAIETVPEAADALLNSVKAAALAVLSPAAGQNVGFVISAAELDLATIVEDLAQVIDSAAQKVVAAMHAYSAKLRSEADATK